MIKGANVYWFLQLATVGEGGIPQEEVDLEVTVSRTAGTLGVAGVTSGMNSETRVSFQGDPGVQLGTMVRITSGLIRTEAKEEVLRVVSKVVLFLLEHRAMKVDR